MAEAKVESSGIANPAHEFDLSLAIKLGGFAFEAYNVPAPASYKDVFPVAESWKNGTTVTFMDKDYLRSKVAGWVRLTVRSAARLPKGDYLGKSDPYVIASTAIDNRLTSAKMKTLDPEWDETLYMFVRNPATEEVKLEVWDLDGKKPGKRDDLLGVASIKVADLASISSAAGEDRVLRLEGGLVKDKYKDEADAPTLLVNVQWIGNTDELSADFAGTMSKKNTDDYLAKLSEQTNGSAFKDLLQAAGIAAENTLSPLMYLDNQASETQAWVFCDRANRTCCLAWRGTEQDKCSDFVTDVNLFPWSYQCIAEEDGRVTRKDCHPIMTVAGPWVHAGFLRGYDSIRETMTYMLEELMADDSPSASPWTLWVTGHSLGGGLATLSSHELALRKWTKGPKPAITMYNFGSPRVGNQQFIDIYNELLPNSWRIVNEHDVVTNIPQMAMGYRHIGNKAKLEVGGTITYKLQPSAGGSTVEGEVDTDDVIEVLDSSLKLEGDRVASGIAAADGAPGEKEAKAKGLKFVWQKAGTKMGTILDGRAINDHMEDVYLANLQALWEKWYGKIAGLVSKPKTGDAAGDAKPATA